MTLKLIDAEGREYRWKMYRDTRRPACWMLEDHSGYVRTLESNYALSVPKVYVIAGNHDFTFKTPLS